MNKHFRATEFLSKAFFQELQAAVEPYQGNDYPIYSTLQALNDPPLNCKTVVFEREYVDKDYLDEYAAFYCRGFKNYPPRAVRLHFFAAKFSNSNIPRLDALLDKNTYLGFLVLRPTDLQRVGRTVLKPTLKDSDKEFIHCKAEFEAHILGQKFMVEAMPFLQQDTQVGACAQASLWMLARYMSRRFGHREFSPAEINEMAKAKEAMGRALPAASGLTMRQMLDALEAMGLYAWSYSRNELDECAKHIDASFPVKTRASKQQRAKHKLLIRTVKLADIAYRYIESGLPVIICTDNHALVGIGHTYDYAAKAATAIQRIPGFIVHDDTIGPYQIMPIFKRIKGHRLFIKAEELIVVVPQAVTLRGEEAESMSRQAITEFLAMATKDTHHRTYKALIEWSRPDLKGLLNKLEYRTFLMPSVEFQAKLRRDAPQRFNGPLAERLINLDYPKFIWITEISSSTLLNRPNRRERQCLGRVIIDSTAPAYTHGEMVVHFADFLKLLDRQTGKAPMDPLSKKAILWQAVSKTTPFFHQSSSDDPVTTNLPIQ